MDKSMFKRSASYDMLYLFISCWKPRHSPYAVMTNVIISNISRKRSKRRMAIAMGWECSSTSQLTCTRPSAYDISMCCDAVYNQNARRKVAGKKVYYKTIDPDDAGGYSTQSLACKFGSFASWFIFIYRSTYAIFSTFIVSRRVFSDLNGINTEQLDFVFSSTITFSYSIACKFHSLVLLS